jgi:hypothetical protein
MVEKEAALAERLEDAERDTIGDDAPGPQPEHQAGRRIKPPCNTGHAETKQGGRHEAITSRCFPAVMGVSAPPKQMLHVTQTGVDD